MKTANQVPKPHHTFHLLEKKTLFSPLIHNVRLGLILLFSMMCRCLRLYLVRGYKYRTNSEKNRSNTMPALKNQSQVDKGLIKDFAGDEKHPIGIFKF